MRALHLYVCLCVCVCSCVYVSLFVCVRMFVFYVCVCNVCMFICMCVCVSMCSYVCAFVCLSVERSETPPNHLGLDFHIYMYIYVRTFLIRVRVLVICDRNSIATKREEFPARVVEVASSRLYFASALAFSIFSSKRILHYASSQYGTQYNYY